MILVKQKLIKHVGYITLFFILPFNILTNALTAIFRITDTDIPLISSSLSYFIKGACDIYIILFIIITKLTDKRQTTVTEPG
jgi:hypothetical protein